MKAEDKKYELIKGFTDTIPLGLSAAIYGGCLWSYGLQSGSVNF